MPRLTTRSAAMYRRRRFHFLEAFLGAALFSLAAAAGWYAGFYTLLHFLVACAVVLAIIFSFSLVFWLQELRRSRMAISSAPLRPVSRSSDWLGPNDLSNKKRPPADSPGGTDDKGFVMASGKVELRSPTQAVDPLACFWRWVPQSGEFYFSPGLLSLLGRSSEVLAPQLSSFEGICHPSERALLSSKLRACADGQTQHCDLEFRVQKNGGGWLWLGCEMQLTCDLKDKPSRQVTGVCRDIQGQKQLERKLTVHEDLHRTLLESSGIGYALFALSGALLDCNESFLAMTGRSAEEARSSSIEDFISKQTKPAQDRAFHALRHGAQRVEAQVDIAIKDGGTCKVIMHAALESTEDERKTVWAIFQEKLANESASPSVGDSAPTTPRWDERGSVLAKIGHEVRTPLTAIVSAADMALEEIGTPAQRSTLQLIRQSAHELFQVFSDYLDISRLDSGSLTLNEELVDIPYLVDRVVSVFALHAEEKSLSFLTQLGENVPTSLLGDAGRLRQIFMSLIGNAVKFTPREGAIIVQIDFDKSHRHQFADESGERAQLHFIVGDTGVGIPKDCLSRIFEPYSEIAPGHNTGIGLAVTKRLVEAMHGQIWVDSTPGQGTAFHFTASFGVPASESTASGAFARPVAKHEKLGLRILLAEDSLINQRIVTRILEKHGCTVVSASDGEQVLEVLRHSKEDFDLVLMDCEMPRLDGFDTTCRLREREKSTEKHIPVIALTAHAMEGDRNRCLTAGMDGYLAKPLDIDALLDELRRWGVRGTQKAELRDGQG